MRVASVNVGLQKQYPWRGGTYSAIHKTPVSKKLKLTKLGFAGDDQVDSKHHGGEEKAVLVLPSSAYLRFELTQEYGFLGENLSIDGAAEDEICLGDRLQIGTVLLEVTQPRSPCWKLDSIVADNSAWQAGQFLTAYSESGHVGFYCRVLAEGFVEPQQSVRWLTRSKEGAKKYPRIPVKTLFLAKQYRQDDQAWKVLKEAVKHPALSKAWLKEIGALLEKRKSNK